MADTLRATPQNPYTGALARGVRSLQQLAAQYQVDPRVPLLGGTGVDELLSLPGAASLLEDVSYNGPRALIRGGNVATGGLGTYKLDPRVADLADVATMAAPVAQGATRALVNLPRSVARAGRDFATSVSPVHVVKPKGGNWLAGSVEQAINPLRQTVREPEYMRRIAQDEVRGLAPEGMLEATHNQNVQAEALNKWLEQKLNKYIRNEMGTPEDPLRALAEQGVTHFPGGAEGLERAGHWVPETLGPRRKAAGFPAEGLATTPAGQGWEQLADEAIHNLPARMRVSPETGGGSAKALQVEQENPWLLKVPPETMTYGAYPVEVRSELDLEHLVDELRNATDPASTLPAHLRWKYQDLDKVTVPQAVERVSDINAWRAAEAARAEREGMMANLNAAPRLDSPNLNLSFVDKPGGKWVDIPDTSKDGMPVCTSIGKAGGWCTKDRWAAESYGSGDNRLTALLDTEGRPHVQVKISTSKFDPEQSELGAFLDEDDAMADQFYRNIATVLEQRGVDNAEDIAESISFGSTRNLPEAIREILPEVEAEAERMLPTKQLSLPDITELKPVGNGFDSKQALEYAKRDPDYKQKVTQSVLDFLNDGEWGNTVNDLDHYDIVDLKNPESLIGGMKTLYGDESNRSLGQEFFDAFNYAIETSPESPRFMTLPQLRKFVGPVEDLGHNYATGGLVQNAGSEAIPYDSAKIDAIVNSLREEY